MSEARLAGITDGLGFDAESKAEIHRRLMAMNDTERAAHLDALKHPADSAEMKAHRRALLDGLLTPAQRGCLECGEWIPARVQFCREQGCPAFSSRPYALLGEFLADAPKHQGGRPEKTATPGESVSPPPALREVATTKDGHCRQCGKRLPIVKGRGRRPVFCALCVDQRRHEQTRQAVNKFRNMVEV